MTDYYRQFIDFAEGLYLDHVKKGALNNYVIWQDTVSKNLKATDMLRLSLAMEFSRFQFFDMGDYPAANKIAAQAIEEAKSSTEEIDHKTKMNNDIVLHKLDIMVNLPKQFTSDQKSPTISNLQEKFREIEKSESW